MLFSEPNIGSDYLNVFKMLGHLKSQKHFVAVVKNVNLSHKFRSSTDVSHKVLESRKRVVGLTGGTPIVWAIRGVTFWGSIFIGTEILGVDLLSGLRILGSIF